MPKNLPSLWSTVAAIDGDGVEVDRPTQLIFFYSCQQTDTNDMAGQSSKGNGWTKIENLAKGRVD